jgi:diguanylate cyclase (GGDEF)-like protein/PAS domain S-box-containing protein
MQRRSAARKRSSLAARAGASMRPPSDPDGRIEAQQRIYDLDAGTHIAFMIDAAGTLLAQNARARALSRAAADPALAWSLYPPWAEVLIREEGLAAAREHGYWRGELAVLAPDDRGAQDGVMQVIEYRAGGAPGQELYACALYAIADADVYESRLRFKRLFEEHPQPMWVYDLETLRFLVVNAAAVRHYGYSEREFARMTIRDIRPPDERARLDENLAATPPKGASRAGLWTHRRKDGSLITVDISSHAVILSGRPSRFVFAHDVSEQLRIADALHASEAMHQYVINHVPQQIFWKDLDLRYRGCNDVFARAAGAAGNLDVIGRLDEDFPWGRNAAAIRAEDAAIIATGQPLLDREDSMRYADGSVHWFLINKLPLHDRAGRVAGVLGTIEDISARKHAELTLQLRGHAIEASVNAIVITASGPLGNLIEYANPAFAQLCGYAVGEVIGRDMDFLLSDQPDAGDAAALRAALLGDGETTILLRNYHRDGSLFWNQLHVAPVRDASGLVSHHVCVLNDLTEVMRYQSQLEHQASHDALTALPNRSLFGDRLAQAIGFAARYGHGLWVVFIDLDNFKFVNDSLGHQAGDALLRVIAGRLAGCVRASDTVARLGGDEFMLVLNDEDGGHGEPAALLALLQTVLDAVAAPLRLQGEEGGEHEVVVTCSIGVSQFPEDGRDADLLLRHADIAMYRAKEAGRNQIRFYEAAMNERIAERTLIETQLRHALARGELSLHYQPRVDLRTGQVAGMEALLRWRHPQLGMVSPARFIGVAEETGLIVEIGAWVLRQACLQNKTWQAEGLARLRVAVNLSPRQFRHKALADEVVAALAESGLDAQYLELELTEGLMMHNVDEAVVTLQRLKRLGIALSIDDFGTGYSSLAYLKLFPLDYLKIDQSFIRDMLGDPSGAAIVRSVIALGHSLNFKIIAEGVETEAQLAYLARYQCDEMQGYHFSRPLPPEELAALLRREAALALPSAPQTPRRTLLLLDDEPNVLAALVRLLRRDGYTILSAGTPQQAFELLAMHEVQVIVSDQRMPVMSGTEFLSRVKKLYPGTIRIILSGYTELESVLNAINRGEIYRFYTKPWDDAALREAIREAFDYHGLIHGAAGKIATL